MSRKYAIRDSHQVYFVTFTVIHWLDVFIRAEYRDIFLESVKFCQKNKGLEVYAFVVMTSHIHMIVRASGKDRLQDIIRDLKKFTANRIVEAIRNNPGESRKEIFIRYFERAGKANPNNTNIQFWQQHNHPIELNTNKKFQQRLDYIHNNPVKAGLVLSAEHYWYSSAVNYARLPEKLIDVIIN